jgi:hypothetical protein
MTCRKPDRLEILEVLDRLVADCDRAGWGEACACLRAARIHLADPDFGRRALGSAAWSIMHPQQPRRRRAARR